MVAGELAFHVIGGPQPYLRIAKRPNTLGAHYLGSVDGTADIRRLRDYLTHTLKHLPSPRRGRGKP